MSITEIMIWFTLLIMADIAGSVIEHQFIKFMKSRKKKRRKKRTKSAKQNVVPLRKVD